MQTATSYAIAQVPSLASIKSSQERYAALGEAPNPLIAERRKNACKDAEIAELRAALEHREREASKFQSREGYVKDLEDTLSQIGKIVGVENDADRLIRAVSELSASST
jgi:hypothetical protein